MRLYVTAKWGARARPSPVRRDGDVCQKWAKDCMRRRGGSHRGGSERERNEGVEKSFEHGSTSEGTYYVPPNTTTTDHRLSRDWINGGAEHVGKDDDEE